MTAPRVRVVIADDQPLVRAGLRTILAADHEIEVVGEAADGLDAITVVRRTSPDLALVDIRMPRLDGLAATREIVSTTNCRVLVLTTFGQNEVVFDALSAGAHGFLLKDTRPEDLLSAIRSVAAGEGRLDPAVTSIVLQHFRRRGTPPRPDLLKALTEREREVLALVARGMSNAEIGAELYLAIGTVKTHVASVLAKLGVRDRVQAVIAAYDAGLVRPEG
jgi:DNA-binding NarL/FixJ family response regulator